ncbi:MAG: 2-octaprenyl-6-methoxyphenyl hydroxylase [Gammaproteobacteria bacterium]|nr:2-octaprenyl-6-methoxyphenyl hydroxylase [Gammaproteobacteria bacterium]
MQTDFDILIVGGGMVGASLAGALRDSRLRVGIVEAALPPATDTPGYDDRTVALAYGSRRIFEAMGVWSAIEQRGAAPIERIHISDRGRFGFTRLSAAEAGVPALGYVVANWVIGRSLYDAIAGHTGIEFLCPAIVQSVAFAPQSADVTINIGGNERRLSARLIIAADGADSPIRAAVGIDAQRVEYEQAAIVSSVTPERAHHGTAYERFTETGPLALLPAGPDRCAVVWTVPRDTVDAMLSWDDDTFRARLQECFGERLGNFGRVGKRQAYPLMLTRVREHVRPRLVLIGNAAHTVHPVAGQGFNLGLRDVAALAQVLLESANAGGDIGDLAVLQRYADWRARDNKRVANLTHSLIRLFSNNYLPLAYARNVGLVAVDLLPPLKRAFVRVTSGLGGRLPRLACGLRLTHEHS